MPVELPFRNGRLDSSPAPALSRRTVTIADGIVLLAMNGSLGALLPSSYPCAAAAQTVPLTSIVLDFSARLVDYDPARLISIIRALQAGTNLPPLSVTARADGLYDLENGYHRFLACALLGFASIPIDQPPPVQQSVSSVPVKKYIPPHLRKK
jgi:hypothetical protein